MVYIVILLISLTLSISSYFVICFDLFNSEKGQVFITNECTWWLCALHSLKVHKHSHKMHLSFLPFLFIFIYLMDTRSQYFAQADLDCLGSSKWMMYRYRKSLKDRQKLKTSRPSLTIYRGERKKYTIYMWLCLHVHA